MKKSALIPLIIITFLIVGLLSSIYFIYVLNNRVNALNNRLNLEESRTIFDEDYVLTPNHGIQLGFKMEYAGYVKIYLDDITPISNVTANLYYRFEGGDHMFETNGYATFPVLPSNIAHIGLVNGNEIENATVHLKVDYFY